MLSSLRIKKIRLVIFAAVILISTQLYSDNKIVFLISPPRSLSVSFLRMMQARGDFSIMHEVALPAQLAQNSNHDQEITKDWFKDNAPKNWDEVKEIIFEKTNYSNVFLKEMSFTMYDHLRNDPEFIKNPNVYFVFLLRLPHHSTISMYKKTESFYEVQGVERFIDLVGYKACYKTFELVKSVAVNKPAIIFSEDLYKNPAETVKNFCDHVGIEFMEKSLHWENLGADFTGHEEWHEQKVGDHIKHWHGQAIESTGFGRPASYEMDAQGKPTFSEIPERLRAELIKAYEENLIYYNLMKAEKNYFL